MRRFADTVAAARTPDAALAPLMAALCGYGYRYARYGFIPVFDPAATETECRFVSVMPETWEAEYQRERLALQDFATVHAAQDPAPIPLADIGAKYAAGELSGKARRAWELAVAYGGVNGVVIPLRDGFPLSRGILTVIASAEISAGEYEEQRQRHMEPLQNVAQAFHDNLHRPLMLAENRRLSPREAECLEAVMRGQRTKQIAYQLGTNEKTVEKQLSSARRKLLARTNTQAAVKALVLGLISSDPLAGPASDDD